MIRSFESATAGQPAPDGIERYSRKHLQLRSRSDLRSQRFVQAPVLLEKDNVLGEHSEPASQRRISINLLNRIFGSVLPC